jgi:hypothetical protein
MPIKVSGKSLFEKVPLAVVERLLEKQSLSPAKPASAKKPVKVKVSRKTAKVRR